VRRRLPLVLAAAGLALTACGSTGGAATSSAGTPGTAGGAITVFAAASLTEAFTTLGRQFEAAHPGTRVTFNFGASSTLATQIVQGAPADVFAAASRTTMDTVTSAGAAGGSRVFAVNTLEIATPTAPTTPVRSLADLARPGVKVAICQPAVPCGATARKLFALNQVSVTPVSEENDVKAVLTKVELGEVDAGVVYVTDVRAAAGRVVGVPIPLDRNVTTAYPIATTTSSANAATARAFVDYVLSAAGQQVLTAAGFTSP
jgi:molybdate transport system substrate-binding protein